METKEENLIFDLFICQRKFDIALKQIADKFESVRNNWEVLFLTYLYNHPGITQYDLCKKFDIERSHINKIIKKLEIEDLLEMRGVFHLGIYRKELYLTKKGVNITMPILKIMTNFKKDLFAKYPLINFQSFINNVALLSKIPQEDVVNTVNSSIHLHKK